jgi:hypothetical protein
MGFCSGVPRAAAREKRASQVCLGLNRFLIFANCNRKVLEIANLSESDQVEKEALRNAEAAASRSTATESAFKPSSTSSWWSNMSLWSKRPQETSGNSGHKPANPNTKD